MGHLELLALGGAADVGGDSAIEESTISRDVSKMTKKQRVDLVSHGDDVDDDDDDYDDYDVVNLLWLRIRSTRHPLSCCR